MGVDFLFHHGDHVERVSHRVETQDGRKFTKAGPGNNKINLFLFSFINLFTFN